MNKSGNIASRLLPFVASAFLLLAENPAPAQSTDPEAARIKAVMKQIRRNMREINALLLEGSADHATAEKIEQNIRKIDELLRETESKSRSVLQGIDELMSLAKPPPQQQQSGQSGEDPQQQQPQQQPRREKSEDPQQLQKQQDQNKDQQQQEQNEKNNPDSPKPDQSPPEQRSADQPPSKGETGEFEKVDTSGRWGILPPKDAEDLQRYNIDDFPQRYRHWMELYYRRVNKSVDSR